MPRKRPVERLHFDKAEQRRKLTPGEVVNVENLHERSPPYSSSAQSTTMEQLEEYVRAGNQAAARQLLTHQAIDLKSPEGGDLLWTAYALEKDEMVAMLVQYGADLSVRKNLDKRTLLHHMLKGSRIESIVTRNLFRLMLDFGADVDARDGEGKSLLHVAITSCHEGSLEVAKELLKRGARVTINKKKRLKDDIYLAGKHKIELLPKLIQHQKPRRKARVQRAMIAMDCLVSEKYTDDKGAAALLMIEKIFELGVPVNFLVHQRGKGIMSFLDKALFHKNIAVVELLLKCGTDFHRQNHCGHTTLYQATAFKDTTQVSRWFIERGVSIQARNYNGDYPIHGACKHKSLKNLHLLINLGADLNATNRSGQTPFGVMQMGKKPKSIKVQQLIIKYLALEIARGGKISKQDKFKINQHDQSKSYFNNCMKQLDQMKVVKVHSNTPYFSLFSKNTYSTMLLIKDQNFLKGFKRDEKRRADLFPDYFYMLLHSFEIGEKKLQVLLAEKEELCKVFMGAVPDDIVEKIAYYLCFDKLVHCHNDYFMSFHAKNVFKTKIHIKR